ncbi:MAG: homoserine kinase [Chthoniobacterales bacterium]|nr:homoserine kinase [Chthoniobacterales bacterium]
MLSSLTITIPASTANLGPGFDSFGIALNIFNQVTIKKSPSPTALPSIVEEAANLFFKKTNQPPFPFSITINGDVPRSRGLGSSVTVRLGVLMGLNQMTENPLSSSELYHLCTSLEGHPDNAAAALFGGFTIARKDHAPLHYPVSAELFFVLLIPNFEISTNAARQLLPATITTTDAAANAADAAVIATAFATKNYDLLRGAFHDRLHQPFRTPLIPFLPNVLAAAEKAGALGGWLSGSGSTIIALAQNHTTAKEVSLAMKTTAPPESKIIITTANNVTLLRKSDESLSARSLSLS